MMTIKEYANTKGITYEAVRKQIERNADALAGHVSGKPQRLDDFAVNFLDGHRRESAVIVNNESKAMAYEELEKQNKVLQQQIIALQQELISEQRKTIDNAELAARYTLLLDSHSKTESDLIETKIQLETAKSEQDELRHEVASYTRTIFGFYRKKKQ